MVRHRWAFALIFFFVAGGLHFLANVVMGVTVDMAARKAVVFAVIATPLTVLLLAWMEKRRASKGKNS